MKETFASLFSLPSQQNGFNKKPADLQEGYDTGNGISLKNGDVLIAAITSCTNTSNPSVLLAAGLLAKKAVEHGLTVKPHIKTSLAPGSRVVTDYLTKTGAAALPGATRLRRRRLRLHDLHRQRRRSPSGVQPGNRVQRHGLRGGAFGQPELRGPNPSQHPGEFPRLPPLVVAYALAGTVQVDLMTEPVGKGKDGKDVYLGDIWPRSEEVHDLLRYAMDPKTFKRLYSDLTKDHTLWNKISATEGQVYNWPDSTYIAEPPFFEDFEMSPGRTASVKDARILGLFGDSITTDHISPAGSIKDTSPAGKYLIENGVLKADFNSYGARRGNHEVMMRGTFANVRIKNLMLPLKDDGSREEGGLTLYQPGGEKMAIYDAAMKYMEAGVQTVVLAGEEYGTGSSRDWAAKGTQLLGVKAVVARSFERIHRSNLVGMGVLPLQFLGKDSWESLGIRGDETIDIEFPSQLVPQQEISMTMRRPTASRSPSSCCRASIRRSRWTISSTEASFPTSCGS
jgi:aconitate hydratase